jgi:hypothetical protein
MKQTYSITVRGKHHEWSFPIVATESDASDWRADGLEVHQVLNSIPEWAQRLGVTRIWCRGQDLWGWLRLW